jgi:hypothetical protein
MAVSLQNSPNGKRKQAVILVFQGDCYRWRGREWGRLHMWDI